MSRAPKSGRKRLRRFGHESVLRQPLRRADKRGGGLFGTWKDHHVVSSEEHELIGVLSGFGAAAIRSIGLYRELDDAYLSTVSALTATIQARDHYREDHQRRVAADALALAERVRVRPDELRDLRYASLFHSLGKIGCRHRSWVRMARSRRKRSRSCASTRCSEHASSSRSVSERCRADRAPCQRAVGRHRISRRSRGRSDPSRVRASSTW